MNHTCKVCVVHRDAILKIATHAQDIREQDGMSDAPFRVLLRPPGNHAPFNDPILKLVEADLLVLPAARHPIRTRTIKPPL